MPSNRHNKNHDVAQLDALDAVACPCGQSRRAFLKTDGVASVHLVNISADARPHYHKTMTEIYVVLAGKGWIELDGERIPVQPLSAVKINPGCRHRAVGTMRILNTVIPAFDPEDEWFDEEA